MMINHLVKVAEIVKKFGDQKVVPIIWDDMIREVDSESIKVNMQLNIAFDYSGIHIHRPT